MQSAISRLPLVEFSAKKKRAPSYYKFRALALLGFQPLPDNRIQLLIDFKQSGLDEGELEIAVDKKFFNEKVRPDMVIGGTCWVLMSTMGDIRQFMSDEEFTTDMRRITTRKVVVPTQYDVFTVLHSCEPEIGDRQKQHGGTPSSIEVHVQDGVIFNVQRHLFNKLGIMKGDLLVMDALQRIVDVVRKSEKDSFVRTYAVRSKDEPEEAADMTAVSAPVEQEVAVPSGDGVVHAEGCLNDIADVQELDETTLAIRDAIQKQTAVVDTEE